MERALSNLVGLDTKLKGWSVVTFVGLFSTSEIMWSVNVLATILGKKVIDLPQDDNHQIFDLVAYGGQRLDAYEG